MNAINLYKEAYSGHPKEVWALSVITFINRMGTMVLPFLTVYLTTVLDFSLTNAGFIASGFGFGSLAGSYLGGRFSDKFGANNVIIASLVTGGIMFIFLQFAVSFYGIMAMIFVTAMFGEAYRPAMTTSMGDYVPKSETGRSMSLIRLAINLGMAGGPAIGGFIAVTLGYHWLFWIDGLTCISAAIIFYFVSRHWKKQANKNDITAILEEDETEAIPPLKNKNYVIFLIATYFVGFVFMQWFHSVPVFLKSGWNLQEDAIGTLIGLSCIIIVVFEMPLIHSVEKAGKIRGYILFGVFLIGVSYLFFLFDGSFALALVIVSIWTCGEMIFMPLNNAIPINVSTKKNRGEYMSYFWMVWSLVHITAPIVSLFIMDKLGYHSLWFFLFGMALISLGLNYMLTKREMI
ncbi:MAG: MFS transporter [Saprospiraceae bacterium]